LSTAGYFDGAEGDGGRGRRKKVYAIADGEEAGAVSTLQQQMAGF